MLMFLLTPFPFAGRQQRLEQRKAGGGGSGTPTPSASQAYAAAAATLAQPSAPTRSTSAPSFQAINGSGNNERAQQAAGLFAGKAKSYADARVTNECPAMLCDVGIQNRFQCHITFTSHCTWRCIAMYGMGCV